MDSLRLLSRGIKSTKRNSREESRRTPSSGQNAPPQRFAPDSSGHETAREAASRKRKRSGPPDIPNALDFFDGQGRRGPKSARANADEENAREHLDGERVSDAMLLPAQDGPVTAIRASRSLEGRRHILKQHKLKTAWLNPPAPRKKDKRRGDDGVTKAKQEKPPVYPDALQSFGELRERYRISSRLARNLGNQGYTIPTEVQMAALPLLLDAPSDLLSTTSVAINAECSAESTRTLDLLTVAPTGSGKTLAFMVPLLHRILSRRRNTSNSERRTWAIILAPTKELSAQITGEGRKLAQGTGVRITQIRKGMRLPSDQLDAIDGGPNHSDEQAGGAAVVVKADVLVSTPGTLHNMIEDGGAKSEITLQSVRYLVLDEADVLLDPLFREQTLGVWNSLGHTDLRVSLWSATMGSNIEELARLIISDRRKASGSGKHVERAETPLLRLVVGLKDSAVPNVHHKLTYAATEQGKLMGLRQLLHPAASSLDSGPALRPPLLVFTQTIERAVALHSELLYDIPAEAGGIGRIAVLHSDLSDTARGIVMTRFRNGEIWVLITTDLLSRGVDFRGVNGVVNYDIPTSSAAYVHRVGRTGRAGREGGVAVTLYSKEDIPYLKHVANVVATAQKQHGAGNVTGGEGVQQWLLDALPSLSKADKQKLKRRGVEARTARGMSKDAKAAKKARISTKAGFVRRQENKRKGAITGSRRRQQASEVDDEAEFGGFD